MHNQKFRLEARKHLVKAVLKTENVNFTDYEQVKLEAYLSRILTFANNEVDVFLLLPDELAKVYEEIFFHPPIHPEFIEQNRTLTPEAVKEFRSTLKNQEDAVLVNQRMLLNYIIE